MGVNELEFATKSWNQFGEKQAKYGKQEMGWHKEKRLKSGNSKRYKRSKK